MELCDEVYDLTDSFPKSELYGLTAQLRRAAIRVPSCIAEGEGRITDGERIQFSGYARGSIYEIETQMVFSTRRRYIASGVSTATMQNAKKSIDGYITHLLKKQRR